MYIFKYQTKDGKFIGFHASTFCQTVEKEENAKHYSCVGDEVEQQKEIILNNFKYFMNRGDLEKFKDLTFEDVELIPQFVQDKQIVYKFWDSEGKELSKNEVINRVISEAHSPSQN